MKRSLIFCAIALVAVMAHTASAAVNVQLNLRYDNPADEAGGGSWELLAGSDTGLAGLVVLVENISGAAAAGTTDFDVFGTQTVGSVTEIVVGSDLITPSTDIGEGTGTTGNVVDDLFGAGSSPAIWENNALLASGSFGALRPAFVATSGTLAEGVNEFDGAGAAIASSFGTQSVRGDSVTTDGLIQGDLNRGGDVDLFGDVLGALGNVGTGTTWDEGDFDASGGVDLFGDVLGALGNVGMSATAPAVGAAAVPEPASLALASFVLAAIASTRRR